MAGLLNMGRPDSIRLSGSGIWLPVGWGIPGHRRAKRDIMRGVGAVTFNIKNDASGGASFRKMHPPEMVVIK